MGRNNIWTDPFKGEESTYPLVLASHSLVSSYLENTKQLGGEPLFINIFTGSQSWNQTMHPKEKL